ncbi:N-formylglutamate deformylase [Frigidibacter sp. RF13]|uniref:N-formylglutamate deformylase n=1 Tax=Frigidibacter sp. RF13 TaxID=2997340 RepID=UPI0022722AA3|nr:N-formylglutamate deformylase [Frigidibacter sp. RF13]MCY1127382.1 N-formylglutamate deformylase [Frigidibacter sp. RF13]
MTPFSVTEGDSPIILGMPHGGTWLPDDLTARLNDNGRKLADTDWHIDRLYADLLPGVTVVAATFHRYVIDANRDPSGVSLYPGQNTTELSPTTDFDGLPIWAEGQAPSEAEILDRREAFHTPYHLALQYQIDRIKALHGTAILWDCHSIRSVIPFLFEGQLPHFNIGTNDGTTCAPLIETATRAACLGARDFETVLNGRFKGGWTTRHYGLPEVKVHAIQMEIAQRAYLSAEAAPWSFDHATAEAPRRVLTQALTTLDRLARSGALS